MLAVGGLGVRGLMAEMAERKVEHGLQERGIAVIGRVEPLDEPTLQVGVGPVEPHRFVEAAKGVEVVAPHGEAPAVEKRGGGKLREDVRGQMGFAAESRAGHAWEACGPRPAGVCCVDVGSL